MAKIFRRANHSGSITKVTDARRRKPFKVVTTMGWTDDGKQIRKVLGYYKTRDEATVALANYNENPYDISGGRATFTDVYEKWSNQKFPTISDSNVKGRILRTILHCLGFRSVTGTVMLFHIFLIALPPAERIP